MAKDLGVKIGTKKEAKFTEILRIQEESQLANEITQEISGWVIEGCKKRIAEEKLKFK